MRKEKSLFFVAATLLFTLIMSNVYVVIAATYINYSVSKVATDDQFDFDGNYTSPELSIDGIKDEQYQFLVNGGKYITSVPNSTSSSYYSLMQEKHDYLVENYSTKEGYIAGNGPSAMNVYAYRGTNAFYFLFEVLDTNILTYAVSPGDAVTFEDSIEFYIDSTMNGGTKPQTDDLQINIGLSGYTRKMQGTGTQWGTYAALMDFEFIIDGTVNDDTDIDNGYNIEIMIPYKQIHANVNQDAPLGIAFGHVDKYSAMSSSEFSWTGIQHYDNVQTPNKYYVYAKNGDFFYTYNDFSN